jgi:malate synthase
VAIYNLMEDAATAEISRAQLWQWIRHPEGKLEDGRKITKEMVQAMIPEELGNIQQAYGDAYDAASFENAARLLEGLATSDAFEDFLTIKAYDQLD